MSRVLLLFGTLSLALASVPGCGNGKAYQLGRKAEKVGEAHRAYEYYCKAGRQAPENSEIAESISRLAPTAATYWEARSRIAWAKEKYADAWRFAMRCLEIQPDNVIAIKLVRSLEVDHPADVADVRRQYLRGGRPALSRAGDYESAIDSTSATIVAGTLPRHRKDRPSAPEKVEADAAPADGDTSSGLPVARAAAVTSPKVASDPTESQGKSEEAKADGRGTSATQIKTGIARQPEAVKGGQGGLEEYLVLRTLSKKDRRFKRRMPAVDGISVELRDTDDDPSVDLDLYDGNRRIRKIRSLRIRRSKLFQDRAGNWFRLTIVNIDHDSDTVRIGIKPA